MYKDFKKSESLDTGFVGGTGIIWMFSGIILGLLVGLGMYYFSTDKSSPLSLVDSVQAKIEQAQSNQEKSRYQPMLAQKVQPQETSVRKGLENNSSHKTRVSQFSYNAILPTLDVPINNAKPIETRKEFVAQNTNVTHQNSVEEKALPTKSQPEKKPYTAVKTVKKGGYLLQVASFKKESKANQTRGRLTKNGIEAYIQKKKVKGRFWYRVIAGPVDQTSVDNWKITAEKLGHRPLIISVR